MPKVSRVLDDLETKGEVSLTQLTQDTGSSLPVVTQIIRDLMQVGYVMERGDGLQVLYSLTEKGKSRITWRQMPPQGYVVLTVNNRRIVLSLREESGTSLTVEGYHMGSTRWNREGDVFAIKLEVIDESERGLLVPRIRQALPRELAQAPMVFA